MLVVYLHPKDFTGTSEKLFIVHPSTLNAAIPINAVFTGIFKCLYSADSVIVFVNQLFPVPGDTVMSKIGAVYIILFS